MLTMSIITMMNGNIIIRGIQVGLDTIIFKSGYLWLGGGYDTTGTCEYFTIGNIYPSLLSFRDIILAKRSYVGFYNDLYEDVYIVGDSSDNIISSMIHINRDTFAVIGKTANSALYMVFKVSKTNFTILNTKSVSYRDADSIEFTSSTHVSVYETGQNYIYVIGNLKIAGKRKSLVAKIEADSITIVKSYILNADSYDSLLLSDIWLFNSNVYFLAGNIYSYDTSYPIFIIMDTALSIINSYIIPVSNSHINRIIQSTNGGILIGYTKNWCLNKCGFIARIDTLGNVSWIKYIRVLDTLELTFGYYVNPNLYIMAGNSNSHMVIFNLDSSGNIISIFKSLLIDTIVGGFLNSSSYYIFTGSSMDILKGTINFYNPYLDSSHCAINPAFDDTTFITPSIHINIDTQKIILNTRNVTYNFIQVSRYFETLCGFSCPPGGLGITENKNKHNRHFICRSSYSVSGRKVTDEPYNHYSILLRCGDKILIKKKRR